MHLISCHELMHVSSARTAVLITRDQLSSNVSAITNQSINHLQSARCASP
jgi:hypothetical protein